MTFSPRWIVLSLLLPATLAGGAAPVPEGYTLRHEETFENGADAWKPTDAKAWRVVELPEGGFAYELFGKSDYTPPHRSPLNISLLDGLELGDFILTARVKTTGRDYGHRDMCIFFGHRDPAHFYYVHIGQAHDPNSHQVMIVQDAPRTSIAKTANDGVAWNPEQWHEVKLVRDTASGRIALYFDDMEKPVLTAVDKTFLKGRIGLGSFDDTGLWDNLRIYTPVADRPDQP